MYRLLDTLSLYLYYELLLIFYTLHNISMLLSDVNIIIVVYSGTTNSVVFEVKII